MRIIHTVFREKTDKTSIQFFRYLFVGGLSFVVDFGLLFLLTEFFSVYYLASAAIAFLGGLITNYLISISWVFNNRTLKNRKFEFLVFVFTGLIGLGLNQLLIWSLTEKLGIYYLGSKIVSTAIVLIWNFGSRKFILFRNKTSS
jgi:putative flippase GtrA